VLMIIK